MKKANKKKKKKNINTYDLPDIPWLDDDCDDARYQMDLIWMQMNPQSMIQKMKSAHSKKST